MSGYCRNSSVPSPSSNQRLDHYPPWSSHSRRQPEYDNALTQTVNTYAHQVNNPSQSYPPLEAAAAAASAIISGEQFDVLTTDGYTNSGTWFAEETSTQDNLSASTTYSTGVKCPIVEKTKRGNDSKGCEHLLFPNEAAAVKHAMDYHLGCPICLECCAEPKVKRHTVKKDPRRTKEKAPKDKFFAKPSYMIEHITTCHIPCYECPRCRKRHKDPKAQHRCDCGPGRQPIKESLIRLNKSVRDLGKKGDEIEVATKLKKLLLFRDESDGQIKKWYDAEDNTDRLPRDTHDPVSKVAQLGQRLTLEFEKYPEQRDQIVSSFIGELAPEVLEALFSLKLSDSQDLQTTHSDYSHLYDPSFAAALDGHSYYGA